MPPPHLEASGSSYDVGLAVGRAFKERLHAFVAFKRAQAMDWDGTAAKEGGEILQDWCGRRLRREF